MEDASYVRPRIVQPAQTRDYFPSPNEIADMRMLPCLHCGAMVQMALRSEHVAWHEQHARVDALIEEAENRHGSSMYCKVTTYELRQALGQDVTGWDGGPKREPRGRHHLTEDHNGDPICNCGWDPARETFPVVRSREQARNDIRLHISEVRNGQ